MVIYNIIRTMLKSGETILITVAEQIEHFIGVYAEGYLLLGEINCLFTDKRYLYAVKERLASSSVEVKDGNFDDVLNAVRGVKALGISFSQTTVNVYKKLVELTEVKDEELAINRLIARKSPEQIEIIKNACHITEMAYLNVLPLFKEGVSELEISAELEYNFKKMGASGLAFETIVAFGANSAVPHHKTCNDRLKKNSVVLMDFGCKVDGFCADMTRTMFFGEPTTKFLRSYEAVKNAHLLAKEQIKSGMSGKQADAIARNTLKADGLDSYFTHSLGHGIGTLIHEFPSLSPRCDEILTDGNVFSIEPGVYFDGEFGIRIEDSVHLSNGKVESFMTDSLELKILG